MTTKNKNSSQRHLTVRTMANHIEALYRLAQPEEVIEGKLWYRDAKAWVYQVAAASNLEPVIVAGILSALSPGVSWEQNKVDCLNFIDAYQQDRMGSLKVGTYGPNKRKAIDIVENCEDFEDVFKTLEGTSGWKTARFFANIMRPNSPDYVCIDRHAYKAAINVIDGGSLSPSSWKRYRETSQAYKRMAKKLKLTPCELQAIVWVVYKRITNR